MNVGELVENVERKLPESAKHLKGTPLVHQALLETLEDTRPGESTEAHYARAAQRTIELERESKSIHLQRTPTDRIFGDALVRALAPRIENLRKAEFGSPDPPFENEADAAQWVEQTSKASLMAYRERSEERKEAYNEISKLASEHQIEIDYKSTLLPYHQAPDDEHAKWVATVPGTYLYRLAEETRWIATRTGLPQDALVVHVLTGLRPVRSRARLATRENVYKLPSGEKIRANEATVTFFARDLTDKELRRIYNIVRGYVGGKGTRGLEDLDEYLWKLVQDMGGPPAQHGSKGRFWRTVQEAMNRRYPGRYTTSKGVQQRYVNILERLQPPRND
jgi:hypothetical protein